MTMLTRRQALEAFGAVAAATATPPIYGGIIFRCKSICCVLDS